LRAQVPLDDILVCPHDGADRCPCRKPKPGLLLTAARRHGIDLSRSWLIGDRWVDVAAGRAAGVRTVLLERPYSWDPTSSDQPPDCLVPTEVTATLREAVALVR
jgi:D-glycero-D-manno-heptose 1,7-bisphosphate phosphatase